jgi:hypothetical protein
MSEDGNLFNWNQVEIVLLEESLKALTQFAQEHPEDTYSFFAFGVVTEPSCSFLLCLDTEANSVRSAQEKQEYINELRQKMLRFKDSWRTASIYIDKERTYPYNLKVWEFTYFHYYTIEITSWPEFSYNDNSPNHGPTYDTYVEGNIRVVIWKVIKELIQKDAFSRLKKTSPFHLGYQLLQEDEQEMVIINTINWPYIKTRALARLE